MLTRRTLFKRAAALAAAVVLPDAVFGGSTPPSPTDVLLTVWRAHLDMARQYYNQRPWTDDYAIYSLPFEEIYQHQVRKPPEVLTYCPGKNKSEWICPEQ